MVLFWASPYQWKLPYVRTTFFGGLGNGMPGQRKYFAWPSFLQPSTGSRNGPFSSGLISTGFCGLVVWGGHFEFKSLKA